jgi:hypothetical protein
VSARHACSVPSTSAANASMSGGGPGPPPPPPPPPPLLRPPPLHLFAAAAARQAGAESDPWPDSHLPACAAEAPLALWFPTAPAPTPAPPALGSGVRP